MSSDNNSSSTPQVDKNSPALSVKTSTSNNPVGYHPQQVKHQHQSSGLSLSPTTPSFHLDGGAGAGAGGSASGGNIIGNTNVVVGSGESLHPSRTQSPVLKPQSRWRSSVSGGGGSGGGSGSSIRRYKYSTDDDEDEIEADLEREYYEGYSDGLKGRIRRSNLKESVIEPNIINIGPSVDNNSTDVISTGAASTTALLGTPKIDFTDSNVLRHRRSELIADLLADQDEGGDTSEAARELLVGKGENEPSGDGNDSNSIRSNGGGGTAINANDDGDNIDENSDHNNDEEDDDDDDLASIASNETFTLRERQDAINTTHPFGIRIWKPAIYKKIRSVQRIAEGDLHSTPGKDVKWAVWFGNILWTLLFGTVLFITCSIASASCLILFWSDSAQQYGRALFKLGTYLWFPFGHYVELTQDENYLDEDEGEGRSIAEYQRWQAGDIEYGRLFFGPSSNNNTTTSTNATTIVGNIANATIESNNDRNYTNLPATTDQPSDDQPASTAATITPNTTEAATFTNRNEGGGINVTFSESDDERHPLLRSPGSGEFRRKRRLFGRGQWNIGRVLFYLWFYMVICPILYSISIICWLGVFSIPMARVATILIPHLLRHPLALSFKPASSFFSSNGPNRSSSIILCTYRAWGWNYYKYTIDGTNIIIINLMLPVLFVIFDYFFLYKYLQITNFITATSTVFTLSLVSIIPLAYFIGQAVASISAQSSMGMGAAINAFFSTIVEVFLYSVALSQGKGDLVEGSIIGSILAGVLLLPGTSMCAGAIRRKTQRYNPRSAGVSSTMLVFAVIGAFAPTVFYQIYGSYELLCFPCPAEDGKFPTCRKCRFEQLPLTENDFYLNVIQPFSITCAILLFVSYVIGLWFTLRTHAAMIWATPTVSEQPVPLPPPVQSQQSQLQLQSQQQQIQQLQQQQQSQQTQLHQQQQQFPLHPQHSQHSHHLQHPSQHLQHQHQLSLPPQACATIRKPGLKHVIMTIPPEVPLAKEDLPTGGAVDTALSTGGHDAPNWSRLKSSVILLGATVLYAIIAEILVDTVDVVLQNFSISEKFLGITVFALVPNTTEFLNAISFAIHGNIALSMEIGSAYALQVCLLQIPALVFYSIANEKGIIGPIHEYVFTLVFPRWDLWAVIFCVFLFSYIYAEGKSNYFKGSILILAYLVVMFGFYFSDIQVGVLGGYGGFILPELSSLQQQISPSLIVQS